MSEKLSAERLENYRARLAVFDVQQCGVFTTEPMVRELLGHIAAQDEEYARQIEILDNAHDATMTQIMDEKDEEIERLKACMVEARHKCGLEQDTNERYRLVLENLERGLSFPEDVVQRAILKVVREALGGEA